MEQPARIGVISVDEGDVQSTMANPAGYNPGSSTGEMTGLMQEVVFLEPGQEKSQKFIKAISNKNACDVMQLLKDSGPLRLTDISERLGESLNATKYHIENLKDAGLIEISNTKYSVKGRKVKIYQMKNQIFIVAPSMSEKQQILSAVMKYGAFLGIYILIAGVFLIAAPLSGIEFSSYQAGAFGSDILPESSSVSDMSAILALLLAAIITFFIMIFIEVFGFWKNNRYSEE